MQDKTASSRPLADAYDYIVVGSGSGGSAVARRLIDGTDATVLLIEAGPSDLGVAEIAVPSAWVGLGRGRYDWGYDYTPTPRVNGRVIGLPRGKVLGGSSSINAMLWYRGHPMDYDAWEQSGVSEWRFRDVLPFFRKSEDWEDGETAFRGAGGPLRIERCNPLHPLGHAMLNGAAEIGLPVIDDANGPDNEGATIGNFNMSGNRRWSAADGYLRPVFDHDRLTVLTGSLAIGLGFEGARAVSVRHIANGQVRETRATTHIVLSLGAIDTPRLLMLSGLGDPDELRRLGIAIKAALPGVGRNLQDHPLVQACVFRSKKPLGPVAGNGGGTMINWKSSAALPQADLHAFLVQGNSAEAAVRQRHDLSGDVFSIGCGLMRSKSTGHLKLLSAEPGGPLDIQPHYLAEQSDLDALVTSVETVMELAATPAYSDWFAGYAAPDRILSRAAIADYIRDACSTFFHTCGTCAMGTGEMAVVDGRLRVHGIDGLTIADASVIPIIPTCNTHAPSTMIGERAAHFLIQDLEIS